VKSDSTSCSPARKDLLDYVIRQFQLAFNTVKQTIPAYANDAFPRNVTVGPDDSTLYVPNADASILEVITTSVK